MSETQQILSLLAQILERNERRLDIQEENHNRQMESINQLFRKFHSPENENVGAPRTKTDTEFLIESLSSSINEFVFDLESNCTFENWFNRYRELFSEDAQNLDDKAKIRLLLRKLNPPAHNKYTNYILPKKPTEFTFKKTVTKLTKIFGRGE